MSGKALLRPRGNGHLRPGTFDEYFRPWIEWFDVSGMDHALTTPAVNLSETNGSFLLSLAAPGLKKEDFNIELNGNILTISSEKETNAEDKNESYTSCEYNYDSFSRSFTLPEEVKQKDIVAEYKNGELLVTLPKQDPAKREATKVAVL